MCGRTRFGTLAGNRIRRMIGGGSRPANQRNARNNSSQTEATNTAHHSKEPTRESEIVDNPHEKGASLELGHEEQSLDTKLSSEDIPYIENFGPGMRCPVIVNGENGYEISQMAWGLIPTYFPSDEKGNHFQLFNKRIEGLASGGGETAGKYFLQLMTSKRCVAVFDGYFEWKLIAGKKQPYYVHLNNEEAMIMPGIYEDSDYVDFRDLKPIHQRTFAILTGSSCEEFEVIHTRQPIFLTPAQVNIWLNPNLTVSELDNLLEELRTAPSKSTTVFNSLLHFYPVTKKITEMKYQLSDCTKEISLGRDMTSFFGKKSNDDIAPSNPSSASSTPVKTPLKAGDSRKLFRVQPTLPVALSVSSPAIKRETKPLEAIEHERKMLGSAKPAMSAIHSAASSTSVDVLKVMKTEDRTREIKLESKNSDKSMAVEEVCLLDTPEKGNEDDEIDLTGEDTGKIATNVIGNEWTDDNSNRSDSIVASPIAKKRGIEAILKEGKQERLRNTPIGRFLKAPPEESFSLVTPSPKKKKLDQHRTITKYFSPK